MSYRRVTYKDRIELAAFLSAGLARTEVADKMDFHKSTITRELKRNAYYYGYSPAIANAKARERYKKCRRPSKFNPKILKIISSKLGDGWSPEQISGRLSLERVIKISHEAIYQQLRKNPGLGQIHLRRYGRKGAGRFIQRKSSEKHITPISQRPQIVQKRSRLGDWERDGMYVAQRHQLLVLNERKSRYVILRSMGHAKPKDVTTLTNAAIRSVPIKTYTITNDRGPEFRDAKSLGLPTYFCDIQKPNQKGTVENTIGLLRQYLKRKTNPEELTPILLNQIESKINFRPRKILDYRTPHEVLFRIKVALAN